MYEPICTHLSNAHAFDPVKYSILLVKQGIDLISHLLIIFKVTYSICVACVSKTEISPFLNQLLDSGGCAFLNRNEENCVHCIPPGV